MRLELILRNKSDSILNQKLGNEWIKNEAINIKVFKKGELKPLKIEGDLQNDSHDKLVSQQSLGFWVKVAIFYQIENTLFDKNFIDKINFKRYFQHNKDKFKKGNRLMRHHKIAIFLILLQNLRNRSFHWENLFKLNDCGIPRLSAKIFKEKSSIVINLESEKINPFLDDFISYFDKKLIDYGKIKVGAVSPPKH